MHETFLTEISSAFEIRQVVGIDDRSGIGKIWPQKDADYESYHFNYQSEVSLFFLLLCLEFLVAAEFSDRDGKEIAEHENGHCSSSCYRLHTLIIDKLPNSFMEKLRAKAKTSTIDSAKI